MLPVVPGTDCNDTAATIFVGAPEIPGDGIDQDCSGADTVTCFEDLDLDGFGSTVEIAADDGDCDDPGESAFDTDCDDDDPDVRPDAPEIADDGIDQDCNGADTITCFVDNDQDGFGSATTTLAPDGSCDTAQSESPVSESSSGTPRSRRGSAPASTAGSI